MTKSAKTLLLGLSALSGILLTTPPSAAQSPIPSFPKGRSLSDPLDLSKIDVTEFIALRYLDRFFKDGTLQPPANSVDTDVYERALAYLTNKWQGKATDAFKVKRFREETIQTLAQPDGPRDQAVKVEYVILDVTSVVERKRYDFDRVGFPFRTSVQDPFDAQREIYLQSIPSNVLKIDPKTAERWIDEGGNAKVLAYCKVGKGLGPCGKGILKNLKLQCEKFEFVSPKTDVLATLLEPVEQPKKGLFGDINQD